MTAAATANAWFGTLPKGWDVVPLRFLARFESGSTPRKSNLDYWDGDIPWVSPKDMKVERILDAEDHVTSLALQETTLSLVPPGAVLLVVRGMILAHSIPVAVNDVPVTINQDMKALRSSSQVLPEYLLSVIQGAKTWFLANTGESSHGTKKLETEIIGSFPVPVPPIRVQRAIVDFLGDATAYIDELIAAKQDLLHILNERRQALIHKAVTAGLASNVPMRASGIPGLEELPGHWDETKLRFLVSNIEQGWSPQADARPPSEDQWGVLKLGAVANGTFKPSEAKALPDDVEPRRDYEVQPGDFLLTRANTPSLVGDACFVEHTRPNLMLCDLIYRLALRTDIIHGRYLAKFLVLPIGRAQIEADARGTSASMVKVSQEHIKNWRVPVPPLDEQRRIFNFVEHETRGLDQMIQTTSDTVQLLRERREAIIAAAVTGQLEVGA